MKTEKATGSEERFRQFLELFNQIDFDNYSPARVEHEDLDPHSDPFQNYDCSSQWTVLQLGDGTIFDYLFFPAGISESSFLEFLAWPNSAEDGIQHMSEVVEEFNASVKNFARLLQAYRTSCVPGEIIVTGRYGSEGDKGYKKFEWRAPTSFPSESVMVGGPVFLSGTDMVRELPNGDLSAKRISSALDWGIANFSRVRQCPGCRKLFVRNRSDQKYCNEDCRNAFGQRSYYERNREKILKTKKAQYDANSEAINANQRKNRKLKKDGKVRVKVRRKRLP